MAYYPGRYFQICDICGFRRYNTETKKNWLGQIVCADTCWETKHPQLDVKSKGERQHVKDARPEPEDTFCSTSDPITADDL